mmetsp:Transcript_28289/g.42842  ORF Transcript_28289/g.42842 Transcript_28289/m.42842 type:complete len:128 (+) Transcript_28289:432-815(+)
MAAAPHHSRKHRHHRHRKRSSKVKDGEETERGDHGEYKDRRLVKKKGYLDEADFSQVTPQDHRGLLPQFGGDAPTPLASERVPNSNSEELKMKRRKKRKKKRESSKSEAPAGEIDPPAFNSETVNAL